MTDTTATWREVDQDVVNGRQRLVFVRSGDHFRLEALAVFADGLVRWGRFGKGTDLDGLRAGFGDGTLTLAPPAGAEFVIDGVAGGVLPALTSWLTPELVIADLVDEVDRLNDRPDSSGRCWRALLRYAGEPSAANLEAVRQTYLAVPEHRRIYVLGDMDQNDVPVRILLADVGDEIPARNPGSTLVVTAASRERALAYFRRAGAAADDDRRAADGPETAVAQPVTVSRGVYPRGWPEPPGAEVVQNDYPATVVYAGREYRSVTHAYWAVSAADPEWHDRIAGAERGVEAESLGREAPRRDGWAGVRLAVMGALLRDKFRRHPSFAATLLATGDARILYNDGGNGYWAVDGRRGTNWVGRLLEVVRSELILAASP
ncbi:NADAR family protein [Actinoplanes sp. NPDC051851]|uniref:NADAR family protein n=1 Tax=Actinoplanes sp. NPDC051851 TaxID=3154753 RepID=UPI003438860D